MRTKCPGCGVKERAPHWSPDPAPASGRPTCNKPAEEIARLYGRSQVLGAGRAAGQALLLADALYGTLAGLPDLRHALAADGRTRWLYHIAMRQLSGRREPVEPTARTGGTMAIHLSQFFLLGGPAFKASELVRQVRAALASKLSG